MGGGTALMVACRVGNEKYSKAVIKKRREHKDKRSERNTPSMLANQNSNSKNINQLIKVQDELNKGWLQNVKNGGTKYLKAFLNTQKNDLKPQIEAQDEYGHTALEWAISNQNTQASLALYKLGSKVKASDKELLLKYILLAGDVALLKRFCKEDVAFIARQSSSIVSLEGLKRYSKPLQDELVTILHENGLKKYRPWAQSRVFMMSMVSAAFTTTMSILYQRYVGVED